MLALSTQIPSAERLPAFSPACNIAASPSEDVLALHGEKSCQRSPFSGVGSHLAPALPNSAWEAHKSNAALQHDTAPGGPVCRSVAC